MGQQPNIELEIEELPRPIPEPGPARAWRPGRPGEIQRPEDVPHGGLFGTPGPDAGFAFTLLERVELPLAEHEHRADTEAALGAIMIARSSHEGRAPATGDLEAARALTGLDERLPDDTRASMATYRKERFAGFAHDPERVKAWEATLPGSLLYADVGEILRQITTGAAALG